MFVTCRLRGDGGWSDVTICNLSDHGLMARCSDPPPRGAFVELRKGAVTIVGQVRWSRDNRIGIRTQDCVDAGLVLDEAPAGPQRTGNDRRMVDRAAIAAAPGPAPAELAARSRRWSRAFEWTVVAAIGLMAAGLLAQHVHALLSATVQRVEAALKP